MSKPHFNKEIAEIAQYDYSGAGTSIFSCIQELLDFIDKFETSDCFFRGQSGLWEVASSLHRHHGSIEQFNKACNISISALEWLKNNRYISSVLNGNDDYAMAIAQHYGCPTDLIDITTDCRTAAYFAASDNDEHKKTPEGCIWVFTKQDIEELQDILKTNFSGCFSALSQDLQDKLAQNKYSQLIQIDIPQLSRLNAQNGAFLWDVCGLLTQQLKWRIIGTQFVFKHIPDEKDVFNEDEGRLFPFPNQLESEIMRIFKERNRIYGLPEYYGAVNTAVKEKEGKLIRGMIPEIAEKSKDSVYFELPDFFVPSFGGYPWTQRTISHSSYSAKSIDMSNYLECHIPFSESGALTLVQHILKSIKENSLTDLLILFYKDKKLYSIKDDDEIANFVDTVITLDNYLYSETEISKIILEWLKMMIFRIDNGLTIKTENEFEYALVLGYINDWITKYYGRRVTKLTIGEEKAVTRFWLPEDYIFLENNYINEFSTFDKGCYNIPKIIREYCENLADNAKIFLYQHKPQKIMPYETMKRMFVELILPQHFAFRRMTDRVYIPDYIDKICLPIFGREIFGFENSIKNDKDYGKIIIV